MTEQIPKKKRRRPSGLNQMAAVVAQDATIEEPSEEEQLTSDGKNLHAVALGRLGGKKGGIARAKKLTPERRREIARQAAKIRWSKEKP